MVSEKVTITKRQEQILRKLLEISKPVTVFTVNLKQQTIASKLKISRQALSLHLKTLREKGLIRTGRGFIDITSNAVSALGLETSKAFVALKVDPSKRNKAYAKLAKLPAESVYRLTGDIDILIITTQGHLDRLLKEVSRVEGVKETKTYVVIEKIL